MVTVITGPPCSGKTTYVAKHKQAGDIVIDYDELAVALGSPVTHDHPEQIKAITRTARNAAIGAALRASRQGARVWIVDTAPGRDRRRTYRQAGAEVIHLTAPRAELHRRATDAGRPARWHHYIDRHLGDQPDPAPGPTVVTGGLRPW